MEHKITRIALKTVSTFVILFTLASCIIGEWGLKDLELRSVEIQTPDKIFDSREIDASPYPYPKIIVINFSSRSGVNLYRVAEKYGYSIHNTTTMCSSAKLDLSQEIVSFSYIFGTQGWVKIARNPASDYTDISEYFHFYLLPSNDRKCFTDPCEIKYNLITNPHDICFKIRGGGLLEKSLESNVVVVPKSALIAAFDAAHIPHGQ